MDVGKIPHQQDEDHSFPGYQGKRVHQRINASWGDSHGKVPQGQRQGSTQMGERSVCRKDRKFRRTFGSHRFGSVDIPNSEETTERIAVSECNHGCSKRSTMEHSFGI